MSGVVAAGARFDPVLPAPLAVVATIAVQRLYIRETLCQPANVPAEPDPQARQPNAP